MEDNYNLNDNEGPFLEEWRWTKEHFKDLYNIMRGKKRYKGQKGIWPALKYDGLTTKFRRELRKIDRLQNKNLGIVVSMDDNKLKEYFNAFS